MKWWIQCYLVDTTKILVGMRDDNGIVTNLIKFDTSKICQEAQVKLFYIHL